MTLPILMQIDVKDFLSDEGTFTGLQSELCDRQATEDGEKLGVASFEILDALTLFSGGEHCPGQGFGFYVGSVGLHGVQLGVFEWQRIPGSRVP